ncbi:hypothetical protein [Streptomyces sp. SP17KL33]|nr:hypothetical protein [Streptomyces sp. SP17KL33]MEE1836066.1 hypothetical protein [Streptomyces sp. SP17KL33]
MAAWHGPRHPSRKLDQTSTDPRLRAAVVDRRAFGGNLIQSGRAEA